jgi:hypothetical protein
MHHLLCPCEVCQHLPSHHVHLSALSPHHQKMRHATIRAAAHTRGTQITTEYSASCGRHAVQARSSCGGRVSARLQAPFRPSYHRLPPRRRTAISCAAAVPYKPPLSRRKVRRGGAAQPGPGGPTAVRRLHHQYSAGGPPSGPFRAAVGPCRGSNREGLKLCWCRLRLTCAILALQCARCHFGRR